jgi:hypothetical protein
VSTVIAAGLVVVVGGGVVKGPVVVVVIVVVGVVVVVVSVEVVVVLVLAVFDVEVTATVHDAATSDMAISTEQRPRLHLILRVKRFFIHSPFVY